MVSNSQSQAVVAFQFGHAHFNTFYIHSSLRKIHGFPLFLPLQVFTVLRLLSHGNTCSHFLISLCLSQVGSPFWFAMPASSQRLSVITSEERDRFLQNFLFSISAFNFFYHRRPELIFWRLEQSFLFNSTGFPLQYSIALFKSPVSTFSSNLLLFPLWKPFGILSLSWYSKVYELLWVSVLSWFYAFGGGLFQTDTLKLQFCGLLLC